VKGYRDDGTLTPQDGVEEAAWMWATDQMPGAAEPAVSEEPAEAVGMRNPARVALGMAVLAAERLGAKNSDVFVVGVGLADKAAHELKALAGLVAGPPQRFVRRTGQRGRLRQVRERVDRVVDDARKRGRATVERGRADADAVVKNGVSGGRQWAEQRAVPPLLDGLAPHLADRIVPRIVDGVLPRLVPELRASTLSVLVRDLASDPRLRSLVDTGRDVVSDAAQQLRSATGTADDRIEAAFRRIVRGATDDQTSVPLADTPPGEIPREP
jgi:polyhydroxyalkanoate synthesis regulator phasin